MAFCREYARWGQYPSKHTPNQDEKQSPPSTPRFQVSSRYFGKPCFTHWNNVIKNAICLAIYLSLQNLISINPCITDPSHTSIDERIVADLASQKWWYVFVIIIHYTTEYANTYLLNQIVIVRFIFVPQIFFFAPFYDNQFNKMRLERIRQHMKLHIELAKDEPWSYKFIIAIHILGFKFLDLMLINHSQNKVKVLVRGCSASWDSHYF